MVRDGAAGTGGIIVDNIDVDKALKLQQPMPVKTIVVHPRKLSFFWEDDGKPTVFFERNVLYYCQCCGELIADESGGVPINTNYCPNCGQKLWWNK